jgi:hypothetical protein
MPVNFGFGNYLTNTTRTQFIPFAPPKAVGAGAGK